MAAYENRLSIFAGDMTVDHWYRSSSDESPANGSDRQQWYYQDRLQSIRINDGMKDQSDNENSWFYLTNKSDRGFEHTSSAIDGLNNGLGYKAELHQKSLPATPSYAEPYFDYLFANTDLGSAHRDARTNELQTLRVLDRYSPDELSLEDQNQISASESFSPPDEAAYAGTFDNTKLPASRSEESVYSSALAPFIFSVSTNGANATPDDGASREVIDTNLQSQTNPVGQLDASFSFYDGIEVEESPSPFHAPLIDETTGFGDIRDGVEAHPEQWTFNEIRPKSYTVEEMDKILHCMTYGAENSKPKIRLQPVSQKAKVGLHGSGGVAATSIDGVQPKQKTVKIPSYPVTTIEVRKRAARESFECHPVHETETIPGDHGQGSSPKKIRRTSRDDTDFCMKSPNAPAYSFISVPEGHPGNEECQSANTIFSAVASTTQPGYTGQFRGVGVEEDLINVLDHNDSSGNRMTMGDYLHPNYVYTHTNFHPCPHADKINHDSSTVAYGSDAHHALDFATDMSALAATLHRSPSKEHLRRQVHLECTSARLEGVSVGELRYYQGHLNVEEYKNAGICVCWDVCACSKTCTRYGDVLCPCSQWIKLHMH